jgi:hypothetical protein
VLLQGATAQRRTALTDLVMEHRLDAWLARERERARRIATAQITSAEHYCCLIRRCYAWGDAAHARGDDDAADRLWAAGRELEIGMRESDPP